MRKSKSPNRSDSIVFKSDKAIPSVIGPDQGWHFVKKIQTQHWSCCVYDVDDDWHPKYATVGYDKNAVFYTKVRRGEKVGIVWDKVPLGKFSDTELAELLGVDSSTVKHARRQRKISSSKSRQLINWDKQPLGKIPDNKLAKQLGISPSAVRKARLAREIPAFEKCG